MSIKRYLAAPAFVLLLVLALAPCGFAQKPLSIDSPVTVSVFDRTRMDTWNWFAAPPFNSTYGYVQSLVRIGMEQRIGPWDWKLELSQPSILAAPNDAIAPAPAGQLGLGATYYAVNSNQQNSAAVFFKQGYLRYQGGSVFKSGRLGRFEFNDGEETSPKNKTIAWLQNARIVARLVGDFGFSNAQRSFDGAEAHFGGESWDLTGMAGRADQGVFELDGNPELNVDIQYLALTKSEMKDHVQWRIFGLGFHDGRTGLAKPDNRGVNNMQNIRIGTYGGNVLTAIPVGLGTFDFLVWGVAQNGSWDGIDHLADAEAVEGGFRFTSLPGKPWIRGGWFHGSGDNNGGPADTEHNTFYQVLPTPRIYARTPFYNLMNNTDEFVQVIVAPCKKLVVRSDMHWLQLTKSADRWYLGGGAFNDKVSGYVTRPSGGFTSFSSLVDVSADWKATNNLGVNFYYAHAFGKSVIGSIYPTGIDADYGYAELVYRWNPVKQAGAK